MIKKLIHSVIPAILLTLAVGSIYAFSLFIDPISTAIGATTIQTQFSFSLGIFFLGMGAAFFGPLVEKNIKAATILGTVLFLGGFVLTQQAVLLKSVWLLYIGYGFIVGTATGIIYISPVKTMMLWFKNNPGIASAVSIISFGFGASLCSLLFKYLYPAFGIEKIFYAFAVVYAVMMVIGSLLLKKPTFSQNTVAAKKDDGFSRFKLMKDDSWCRRAWLFMFLNISAGLALIGCAASILKEVGMSQNAIVLIVATMGILNTLGRFVFAWFADLLKEKKLILWLVIPALSVICLLPCAIALKFIVIPLILIPALYGAGFSTCPSILSNKYGMNHISTIHGMVLSAWGVAGLVGNQIAANIFKFTGSYSILPIVLGIIYAIIFLNTYAMRKQ